MKTKTTDKKKHFAQGNDGPVDLGFPLDEPADPAMAEMPYDGIGAQLAAARAGRGWSLKDVADRLKIRVDQLIAIEAGHFDRLPGTTYAAGFVRSYSLLVGVNWSRALEAFNRETENAAKLRYARLAFRVPAPEGRMPRAGLIVTALAVLTAIYVGWYAYRGSSDREFELVPAVPERLASQIPPPLPKPPPPDERDAIATPVVVEAGPPPPAAVEQLPTVVPPAAPPVAVVEQFATAAPPDAPPVSRTRQPAAYGAKQGDSRILLRANADTWIQVQAVGQDPLFSKMLREGDSYYVPNRPDLLLTTGNAGGVEMFVDGKPLPPLGPSGAIRRNIPLEPGILGASAIGN